MARIVRRVTRGIVSSALCLLPAVVFASEPPDSAVNPSTGAVETADSPLDGSAFKVRHTINPGQGQKAIVFDVAIDPLGDPEPRLAIGRNGDTWVTWWSRTSPSRVMIRKRTHQTGTWSEPRIVSGIDESGAHPRIASDGSRPWVAYLAASVEGTAIEVLQIIDDGPDPFGPAGVAVTGYSGDVDLQLTAEGGQLWVTWIDSESEVGWCRYDRESGRWGSPQHETYTTDGVAAACSRIRAAVLEE